MPSSLAILNCYATNPKTCRRNNIDDDINVIDMTHVQADGSAATPGTDGSLHTNITCYGSNWTEHFRNKCPIVHVLQLNNDDEFVGIDNGDDDFSIVDNTDDINHSNSNGSTDCDDMFVNFYFAQALARYRNIIPHYLILLDSESKVCTFYNLDLVTNIQPQHQG